MPVEQLLCLLFCKRLNGKSGKKILANQFFHCFYNFLITVLIISTYKKDFLCPQSKKESVKKLKAHGVHPLDIIKEKHQPVAFGKLPAHFYGNALNTLERGLPDFSWLFSSCASDELMELLLFLLNQICFKNPALYTLLQFPKNIIPWPKIKLFFFGIAGRMEN